MFSLLSPLPKRLVVRPSPVLSFLGFLLIHTPTTSAEPFATFSYPAPDANLVIGSTVDILWEPDQNYSGTALFEVGEAEPSRHFVYTDDNVDYPSGNYTWSIPTTLSPGSYSIRLAQTTDASIFSDSSTFSLIHAAPPPSPTPEFPPVPPRSHGLSDGDKIGIGAGVAVGILVVLCGILMWWCQRRKDRGRFTERGVLEFGNTYRNEDSYPTSHGGFGGGYPGSYYGYPRSVSGHPASLGGMSPATAVATASDSPVAEHGFLYKLPEALLGVEIHTSNVVPSSNLPIEPIELPTELYRRSVEVSIPATQPVLDAGRGQVPEATGADAQSTSDTIISEREDDQSTNAQEKTAIEKSSQTTALDRDSAKPGSLNESTLHPQTQPAPETQGLQPNSP